MTVKKKNTISKQKPISSQVYGAETVPADVIISESNKVLGDIKISEIEKEISEIKSKVPINESTDFVLNLHKKLLKKNKKLKEKISELQTQLKDKKEPCKIIGNTIDIVGNSSATLELLAGRAGAFKPHKVTILCKKKSDEPIANVECSVSICDVSVMGAPQLISYSGATSYKESFDSKYFENSKLVDWAVFGSSAGQGLDILIRNYNPFVVAVSIIVEGDAALTDYIGIKP